MWIKTFIRIKKSNFIFLFILFNFVCLTGCLKVETVLKPNYANEQVNLSSLEKERYGLQAAYEHFTRAKIHINNNNYESALTEMSIALSLDPYDFLLHLEFANILMNLGDYNRAKLHIAQGILFEPTSSELWILLAKLYLIQGDEKKTLAAARHGIKIDANSNVASLWLAKYYKEHYSDIDTNNLALELYRLVVIADPKNTEARLGLGQASLFIGNNKEATNNLAQYLKLGGTDSEAVVTVGNSFINSGKTALGIELLEIAVSKRPRNDALRIDVIEILIKEGLFKKALAHIRTLKSLMPKNEEEIAARALWFMKIGKAFEGRKLIVDIFGVLPKSPLLRLTLAKIEIKLSRLETAKYLLLYSKYSWPQNYKIKAKTLLNSLHVQ